MIMKLLSSEEEYFRIILEKYENESRSINFNIKENNNIVNNENEIEIDKRIYKQYLSSKSFSCWVDVFLFNFNYIFNDYLPQVNSENFEDLSKIEMLSIIIKYLNELSDNDLRKGFFAIFAINCILYY